MSQRRLPPELEAKLNSLECPFKWTKILAAADLYQDTDHKFLETLKQKLDTSDDNDFLEYGFASAICLIYEYITRREAHNTIKEVTDICQAKLNSAFENGNNHSLLRKAGLAFVLVLQSCKAYFECNYGDVNSLQDILKDIPGHNEFNQDILACINGIKAAFLLTYGPYKTTEIGVQCAKNAVELDRNEGWYCFLVGKGLYRHRRAVNRDEPPSDEEIAFMERAKQLEFKLKESNMFLIEMYSEMIQKGKCVKDYLNRTEQLCRSSYQDTEDWFILWRCVRGLMRIRNLDQQHTSLMQQCLEKANRLSPNNPEILYLFSKFYECKECNLSNARYYAQLAIEYSGATPMFVSHLVRLNYKIDPSMDLIPIFDELISKTQTAFHRHICMCLKARYLLQERQHNLKIVVNIFAQILQEDPDCLQQEELKRDKQLYYLMSILFCDIQNAARNLIYHNKDEGNYCGSKLVELKQLYPVLKKIKPLHIKNKRWWNTFYNLGMKNNEQKMY